MTPEFWLQRWRENRIGFHQSQINSHLEACWPQLTVPPGSLVFVPLCGKSLDMLWFAGQGYRILGVEISPLAIKAFFEENRLMPTISQVGPFQFYPAGEIEIFCGDFFDLQPVHLTGVRAVYDRASLIALPPEMRKRYVRHLREILPPHTPILLITLDYPQMEREGPPFAVGKNEVRELFADGWEIELIEINNLQSENESAHRHPYFREQVFILR